MNTFTQIFARKNRQLLFLGITLMALVTMEYLSPKEIDWTISLSADDKIPYGSYVLYDVLPDIFPEKKIKKNEETVYQFLNKSTADSSNYIFITPEFKPDEIDLNNLLTMVSYGTTIFISAIDISQKIADTLKFDIVAEWNPKMLQLSDSIKMNFSNKNLKSKGYFYKKAVYRYHFRAFDTLHTTVLGSYNDSLVNFIKIPFGAGNFLIHTQPLAFTNYNMLIDNNAEYVSKALSYMPAADIIWDEYYKPNKVREQTPLRYILKNNALRAAYYILIVGILILMFFESKRRQRIIPIVEPPKNTSLEFTETIGRLYFSSKNHKDIAEKKIIYLLEFLRSNYYLKINMNVVDFKIIAEKTGANEDSVKRLFSAIQSIQSESWLASDQLFRFNGLVEDFYKECK